MMTDTQPRSAFRIVVTGLVAIAAIGAAAWLYADGQAKQQSSAAEIAQLKLSLELYGRQYTATATSMTEVDTVLKSLEQRLADIEGAAAPAVSKRDVDALEQRLSALEESWLNGTVVETTVLPEPSAPPPPPPQQQSPPTETSGNRTDCVSPNSPFLVAAGDIFPICGTTGWVAVADIGEQSIAFANGDTAYVGRSMALEGTGCTLTVRSANAAWLAGYGEVQVSC